MRIPSYYTYTPVPTGFVAVQRSQRTVQGDYDQDVAYTFVANEVPALKEDEYVLDIDDYKSGLKYELYSSQFPNATQEFYVKDWDEVAKDLMNNRYFGKEIRKRTKELEPFIQSLEGMTDEHKIYSVYTYVQQNYSWNGDYGIGKNEGVKNLLKYKSGNIGDINLLLLNLLIQSGINAKPFALKSRSSGLLNANFPSRTELNYLLAFVPVGDSFLLLDATSKYVPIGQLPGRAVNINGLLIDDAKGQIVNIRNPNNFKSITMATYDIDLDSPGLVGSGKKVLKDYGATRYRMSLDENSGADDDEEEEELSSSDEEDMEEDDDFIFENTYDITEITNAEDITKDIKLSFNEAIYDEMNVVGNQIFIDATLDFGIEDNPFYEKTREFPVFIHSCQ